MGVILEVNHLKVSYKKEDVIKDVSFFVEEDTIVGIVGESGCGKSTLAKTILGLHKQYKGSIVSNISYAQMVFQDPYSSLNPKKTILFSLMEPLLAAGEKDKKRREEKAYEMLEKVGLSKEEGKKYPSQLSGGQRQRVCIGIALIRKPELLIADEAVSALDVTIQKQILELLLKLQKEFHITILFISHDMRVVYQICEKMIVMKEGKIVEEGFVKEIFENPKSNYTKELIDAII
ncbi:MAG: ABC transporter ATP-binding protein [Lachnospiraceae bacterium]